jgi:hypothetical protein
LAYIENQHCVLRFDDDAGKGDHKHLDEVEAPASTLYKKEKLADAYLSQLSEIGFPLRITTLS